MDKVENQVILIRQQSLVETVAENTQSYII